MSRGFSGVKWFIYTANTSLPNMIHMLNYHDMDMDMEMEMEMEMDMDGHGHACTYT